MDHIWEALNRLKKSLTLKFLKKLAIILRQDFLKTLYILGNCDDTLYKDSNVLISF